MQCEYHPHRIAVGRCHKCGNRFCVECAEETGQTRLCRRCLEQAKPAGKEAAQASAPAPPPQPAQAPTPPARAQAPEAPGEGGEAFLARGPDYDFSDLKREARRTSQTGPGAARAAQAEGRTDAAAPESPTETAKPAGLDLDDVLASLAGTTATAAGAARPRGEYAADDDAGEIALAKSQKERLRELREQKKREKLERRQERADRWDFLSQPRQTDTTYIALSKPRAVLFVLAMWLMAAALWAVPNAYLVPRDSEWVIHAVLVGLVVSLCFWWKAGKKHSTKLAVQAMLVTVFGLLAGEFLHAFLIVMKQPAFRTIFVDIISFKFIWDNGSDLLSAIVEDMFPVSYLWILLPSAAVAFLVGYGMPPIPEVFFDLGRALKGKPKAEKGHV